MIMSQIKLIYIQESIILSVLQQNRNLCNAFLAVVTKTIVCQSSQFLANIIPDYTMNRSLRVWDQSGINRFNGMNHIGVIPCSGKADRIHSCN